MHLIADVLVHNKPEFQHRLRETSDAIRTMVGLYKGCTSRSLLQVLTDCVSSAVRGNYENQKRFVAEGVAQHIAALTTVVFKSLVLSAIEAFHSLAEANPETQQELLAAGIADGLLNQMKRTRYMSIQVLAECANHTFATRVDLHPSGTQNN